MILQQNSIEMKNNQKKNYLTVLESFSNKEWDLIVQLKRFFECVEGDTEFRKALNSKAIDSEQYKKYLQDIGVHIDLKDIAPFWENPEAVSAYLAASHENREIPKKTADLISRYPTMQLWFKFIKIKNTIYKDICTNRSEIPLNPEFNSWRMRRIASAESELGAFNHHIDHPTLAVELNDGCGVGCWFCSFSAEKLKPEGTLDYNKNKSYFREVIQTLADTLGKGPASLALLYYATEPHDNPHYINFMEDFEEITGAPVCTSTAVGSDEKWIRDLISFYRPRNQPWPRLSILSTTMLHKVHAQFTPAELRDVNMIMQMRDSEREKVSGGKILDQKHDLRKTENKNYLENIVPQGSIACVSGFLINLIRKDIKLVSPCYTCEKWPFGYRVFDEATFDSAEDFGAVISSMISRNMPTKPSPSMPFRLRDDLVLKPEKGGFDLVSPNQIHHFKENEVFPPLGKILAEDNLTYEQVLDKLINEHQQNPFIASAALRNMFDQGFLDEV